MAGIDLGVAVKFGGDRTELLRAPVSSRLPHRQWRRRGGVTTRPGAKNYTPYVAHFEISLWRAVDVIYVSAYGLGAREGAKQQRGLSLSMRFPNRNWGGRASMDA
ncbi:unnamed protein product [Clonostachys rosea f. rosea IK726]|uniref:Uncharacterized protein n=2 Tax=Bionectria ochroleuca TaxID=29856 RepID=A0A0B7JT50_BIOOC|nr:unnamed protein product [Clonostachys rosea f. rosea IK726]